MPEIGAGSIFLGVLLAFARGLASAPLSTYSPVFNERVLVILLVAGLGYLSLPALRTMRREQSTTWTQQTVRIGVAMLFLV